MKASRFETTGCLNRRWRVLEPVFLGEDAYSSLEEKAAALLQSVAKNRGLVDGNKRLALASTSAVLGMNLYRLTFTNDQAYELVMAVAAGELDSVGDMSERLKPATSRRTG